LTVVITLPTQETPQYSFCFQAEETLGAAAGNKWASELSIQQEVQLQ